MSNHQPPRIFSKNSMRLLYDSIYDYKEVAEQVELRIQEQRLDQQSDRWFSLKSVSHFNFGIALELMLKFLLAREKRRVSRDHLLAKLYGGLLADTQTRIQNFYTAPEHHLALLAFAFGDDPVAPETPKNRKLNTVQQFFKYFDEDVMLWSKRYEWEKMNTAQWRHYLSDIRPFTYLIDRVMDGIDRP